MDTFLPSAMRSQSGIFATLRKFARKREPEEHCELCGIVIPAAHRHLIEVAARKIVCACDPCALRFQDVEGGRFKLLPRDARRLTDFRMSEGMWEDLALPINLVFLFQSSAAGKMTAIYPSPAGAMESLLPLSAWDELVEENPVLAEMRPDVEALLVNRVRDPEYYIAPMDACYELVGLVRMHWRGFAGGEEVWNEISAFFERLRGQSAPVNGVQQHLTIHA